MGQTDKQNQIVMGARVQKVLVLFHFRSCDGAADGHLKAPFVPGARPPDHGVRYRIHD